MRREFVWVVIGQVAAVSGTLVGLKVLTGLLPIAAYGEFMLVLAIALFAQQALYGPLSGAVLRFTPSAVEAGEARAFALTVLRLAGLITALLCAAAALLGAWPVLNGSVSTLLVISSLAVAVLLGFSGMLESALNALRMRERVAAVQGAGTWLRLLAAVVLINAIGARAESAILGYAIASALILVWQGFRWSRHAAMPHRHDAWHDRIKTYAAPIAIFGVFTWLQLASDRWSLELFVSTDAVARYAVLYQLGYYPMTLLSMIAMQYATPFLFAHAGTATEQGRLAAADVINRKLFHLTLGATALAAAVAWVVHPFVFRIFVAPAYAIDSHLLPVMMLSGGLFSAGQTAALVMMSGLRTDQLVAPKIGTALAAVAFNIAGAMWRGLTGVVIAGVIVSALYCAWTVALASSHRRRVVAPDPDPLSVAA